MKKEKGVMGLVCVVPQFNIVGDVTLDNDGIYTIKTPVIVSAFSEGIGMVPLGALGIFTKTEKPVIRIDPAHVLFEYEVDDELANQYRTRFGNGIVVPTSFPPSAQALPGHLNVKAGNPTA